MKTSLPEDITDEIKAGQVLAGDDLDHQQLLRWYEQEKEAYFEQDADAGKADPWYAYMRHVNKKLVFRTLSAKRRPGSMLFLGAGDGVEAAEFYDANPKWHLTFIESSDNFKSLLSARFPRASIADANVSGDIALESESQDVVCANCVLHHIANVSHVICEIHRILKPGGLFFVKEPCSSMGDWRGSRSATPNERGISKTVMNAMATQAGFVSGARPVPVVFEPINKLLVKTIGYSLIPTRLLYAVDRAISWAVARNDHCWRDSWYKKLGPSSYHYVFQKPVR